MVPNSIVLGSRWPSTPSNGTFYIPRSRDVNYRSMIPRLAPIVTAWVRSLASSLARMFRM